MSSSLDQKLQMLTQQLNELKTAYELYFAGQLKIEPAKEHQAWKREYQTILSSETKSTGQKFRLRNLQARYIQLSTHWGKVCKQIEEGRFRRDIAQLQKAAPPQLDPITKDDKLIDSLYQKLSAASEKSGMKLPSKEKFSQSISKSIEDFRKKHPSEKMEVKLLKDKKGKLQVQLKAKAKP